MRIKKLVIGLACIFAASMSGCTSTYLIRGEGGTTCASVNRKINEDSQYRVIYNAWLLGYLTRYNYEHERKLGKGYEDRALIDTALQYCGQNPLDNFDKAAEYVIEQLDKRV